MKYLLTFLACVCLLGCKNLTDPCDDYLCFTPPPQYIFQMVDAQTGDDLFLSGKLDSTAITATRNRTESLHVRFHNLDTACYVEAEALGWNTGEHQYYLNIGTYSIVVTVEVKEMHKDCCTFYETKTFNIQDYSFEQKHDFVFVNMDI